jgi:hypothetical protein
MEGCTVNLNLHASPAMAPLYVGCMPLKEV